MEYKKNALNGIGKNWCSHKGSISAAIEKPTMSCNEPITISHVNIKCQLNNENTKSVI